MSLASVLAHLVGAMAAVVAVMWVAARLLNKHRGHPRLRSGPAPLIEVLARRGFSRSSSVAVVRACGRTLILGVTDTHVTLLSEADPDAPAAAAEERMTHSPVAFGPSPARTQIINSLRERTVRR